MKFGRLPIWIAGAGLLVIAGLLLTPSATVAEPALNSPKLERSFAAEVSPLLATYCHDCHSGERIEAEIDLAAFATLADVRKKPQIWQKAGEMLDSGQMPPKDAPQPTDSERAALRAWVREYLTLEAEARAGDPGRVILRRLNNIEYTHTLRDLTGVDSLDPAREFPTDGAAGEGFTNTGAALVMSPSLVTKYLDAAKEVAGHAVLLPDGIRFSPHVTRRDWTDDTLTQIRDFYREFTDSKGGTRVNLQGIISDTNQGGRLPLPEYLVATLAERDALKTGDKSIEQVAREHGLNARYLGALWNALNGLDASLLLDGLRARWAAAGPDGAAALAADIAVWQQQLWKFGTVGHIGKVGGPKAWMEPVSPLVASQEIRFKIPSPADGGEVKLSLVAMDAGDGSEHDLVIWRQPRLVAPGRPDILLRDVRQIGRQLARRRAHMFASAARYLAAADEAAAAQGQADPADLALKHEVDDAGLRAWLDYLGIGAGGVVDLQGHFSNKLKGSSGYDFINGWGSDDTPLLVANSSDQHVRIPGNMKPHSVAVHPSPTQRAAVGWRSPVAATLRLEGKVTHAHPECGNGVTWTLELRRGAIRRRMAAGIAQGAAESPVGPLEAVVVQPGDLISLLIGPRDGNHSCDLTAIDLTLTAQGDGAQTWDLAADVSGDVLAGNPHADHDGVEGVWHFYIEPEQAGGETSVLVPNGSLLARWLAAPAGEERAKIAEQVQSLLASGPPAPTDSAQDNPDVALYRQLASLGGPLLGRLLRAPGEPASPEPEDGSPDPAAGENDWGLDPGLFGVSPRGRAIDPASLGAAAPAVFEMSLPADLVEGCELVATGMLDDVDGVEGTVQLKVVAGSLGQTALLEPGLPILANESSAARRRVEASLEEFRQLFPAALCYTTIVPVDEVVTLTLFYREDDHLVRLMLDPAQKAHLDRLWDELRYISQDALTLVDAYLQLMEYATQDADPTVFEPMRKPINDRAAAFRQLLIDTQPMHLQAVVDFAAGAYRRPLSEAEARELRALYARLREQELPHEKAIRLTLARVLVAPAFLYRVESPVPGEGQGPVTDWELASRLSYFLWSSQPDEALRQAAAAGGLGEPEALRSQMRRMLGDPRVRRLGTEFGCQWLHIHDFENLDEKSERHFPTFAGLRGAMYEESIQFFTDLFQNNGSVLDILDADYTFLNEELAVHYGIPGVSGPEWRRVDGVKQYGRGGILAQATTLATQSGASRTSPILRGNWISEVLLGERLPRPPKDVPQLPEDEAATEGLTVRQLVERHSSDPRCAVCHKRIDAFGFALEGFDAIGRRREKDLGDRLIETRAKTMDGAEFEGIDGLRGYLLTVRRDAFLRQFCRKLLGYALGRSVQLSDEPLLAEMQQALQAKDYRVMVAVEMIVSSRQFREIRGRQTAYED